MGKRAHKRQKTDSAKINPLGSVDGIPFTEFEEKDDEERRLESIVFGAPFVSSTKSKNDSLLNIQEGEGSSNGGVDAVMQVLQDSDLFFVDEGDSFSDEEHGLPDFGVDFEGGEADNEIEDDAGISGSSDEDVDIASIEKERLPENNSPDLRPLFSESESNPATHKTAPWIDSDDANIQVSLANNKRLRKLRDTVSEDVIKGPQYESKLRREFEKINPVPEWAAKARSKLHGKNKRRRKSASGSEDEKDREDIEELLNSTNGLVSTNHRTDMLPKGILSIERLRDANQAAKAEGEVKSLMFHPSPAVSVLLTASADRRLRLFSIDGHTNPHLKTIHIPELPMTQSCFHPSGNSILLTGPRPFYYTYDLQTEKAIRSPRGLWGTTFTNQTLHQKGGGDMSMEICSFSPKGDVLAVAGRGGYVHLVDWTSGASQVVGSVKMNSAVKAVAWTYTSRPALMTLGSDSEIYMWDVGERRCVRRWKDDGGFGSNAMASDANGQHLSIGSRTGFVNVYGSDAFEWSSEFTSNKTPKPLKALGNLTTSISCLRFNHDSQLLAMASHTKKDQLRLVHVPSLTVFSNWPTSGTPLSHVSAIDFSPGSEYMAVGNNRGRVLLYHLPHFRSS